MSDLGTQRYHITNNPGNQANFTGFIDGDNSAKIEAARQHANKNPVGKVMDDFSGSTTESQDPFGPIKAFLYGIPTVFGLGWINNQLTKGETAKDSRMAKAMSKLDEVTANNGAFNRINGYFNGLGNWIKDRSFVKHFAQHSKDYEPISSFAKQSSRTLQGDILGDLINETKGLYAEAGRKPFQDILSKADELTSENRYRSAADNILKEVKKKAGQNTPDSFKHLTQAAHSGYEKAYNAYQEALKTGDKAQIERSARKFAKKAVKTMGEFEANEARLFAERFKYKPISGAARQSAYKELLEKLGKLVGVNDTGKLVKSIAGKHNLSEAAAMDKAFAEMLEKAEAKGLSGTRKLALKVNRARVIMEGSSNSFLSKGLKSLYVGAGKVVRPGDPLSALVSAYFLGDVIKKTIEAKKGEKLSTFMEGMAGEVLPFWVMMSSLTRLPYEAVGGLTSLGKNSSWPLKALAAPVRWTGNLVGLGLDGKLTHKMSKIDAEKLLKDKTAIDKFNKLQKEILEGKAGPKGPISRLMSGDFKFWRGAGNAGKEKWKFWHFGESNTWKEMRHLFKEKVPFWKRMGIKTKNFTGGLGRAALILLALMPFVGGILTKVSHSIFGKPTNSEEEGKKSKEITGQADTTPQQTQPETAASDNLSPLARQYLQKINGTGFSQPQQVDGQLSMVEKYKRESMNNSNNQTYQTGSGSETGNNLPARTLNTAPQKNYFSVPQPISTDSQAAVEFNKEISKIDRVLLDAEQTLQSL